MVDSNKFEDLPRQAHFRPYLADIEKADPAKVGFGDLPREIRNKIYHELFKQDITRAGTHNLFTEDKSLIVSGRADVKHSLDLLAHTSVGINSELILEHEGTKSHNLSYRIDQVFTGVIRIPESLEHWEAVYREKNEVPVERFVQGIAFHKHNFNSVGPITSLTFVFHPKDSFKTEWVMPPTSPFMFKLAIGGLQHLDKTPTVTSVAPRSTGGDARKVALALVDFHKDVKDVFHAHASVFDASRIQFLAKLFSQRCREAIFSHPTRRFPRLCARCVIGPKWQYLWRSEVPEGEAYARAGAHTWACLMG